MNKDSINATKGLSPHMGNTEHLSLYINGKRLDELLAEKVDTDYLGLIPAWLDYYDDSFVPSMKEKQYVWNQTKLSTEPTVLPIMLCPDDFDFSCTVIVVEVVCNEEAIVWNRFGVDNTPFDSEENDLPRYIGKEVRWFKDIGPFVFSKQEYLSCISQFPSVTILGF